MGSLRSGTIGLLALVSLTWACGSDDRPAPLAPGGGSGGGGSGGGGGRSGTGGQSTPGAPVVEVVSPEELADPNSGGVLVSAEVKPVCKVTQSKDSGAKAVDPASVKLEMLDAADKKLADAAGVPTSNADEYQSGKPFVLTTVPNGPVSFRCSAEDTSSPPKSGSDTNRSFVDHGPTITPNRPLPDSSHALIGLVPFEFKVEPAPLVTGDPGAEVREVTLDVATKRIPISPGSSPGAYTASVDLTDRMLFPEPLLGSIAVVIRGTNNRSPDPVTATKSFSFKLDGTGPDIAVTSHKNQQVVGGEVTLVFTVIDALSAVDKASVTVKLNGVESHFDPANPFWTELNGTYRFRFDSNDNGKAVSQLTVNIDAKDQVGNASAGESLTLYLDNQPPVVDLDPKNVRELKKENNAFFCSNSFDPVGDDVPNDLETVPPYVRFRTVAWDYTNEAPGQTVLYHSALDRDSVYVYLQANAGAGLLVDTNGDGVCDDLDTTNLPLQHLAAVLPTGNSWYGLETTAAPPLVNCTSKGEGAPKHLCDDEASPLTRIIQHTMSGTEPVIYGIGQLTGLECTGGGWEFGALASEGWVCVAAKAKDKVGNIGISAPLRLCFDDPTNGPNPCTTAPPSCVRSCSLPPRFGNVIIPI